MIFVDQRLSMMHVDAVFLMVWVIHIYVLSTESAQT